MQQHKFQLTTEYIELNGLLKFLSIAQTGGHAKMLIDDGLVKVNGIIESRRRYKVRQGDQIVVENNHQISID